MLQNNYLILNEGAKNAFQESNGTKPQRITRKLNEKKHNYMINKDFDYELNRAKTS